MQFTQRTSEEVDAWLSALDRHGSSFSLHLAWLNLWEEAWCLQKGCWIRADTFLKGKSEIENPEKGSIECVNPGFPQNVVDNFNTSFYWMYWTRHSVDKPGRVQQNVVTDQIRNAADAAVAATKPSSVGTNLVLRLGPKRLHTVLFNTKCKMNLPYQKNANQSCKKTCKNNAKTLNKFSPMPTRDALS